MKGNYIFVGTNIFPNVRPSIITKYKSTITIMKNLTLLILLLLFPLTTKAQVYDVVPLPQSIQPTKGEFSLSESMPIAYPKGNAEMKRNAEFLTMYINQQTGWKWSATEDKVKSGISLALDKKIQGDEDYRISVTTKGVTISGKTPQGVFYGIQALRKIVGEGTRTLPCAVINDTPRFSYRGTHIDCSRHFFPVEFVKRYIDIIALHGINRLHWHLSDDQGWRFEVKSYPELVRKGSVRKQTVIGHNTGIYDNTPHGGYYTQDECREIVKYAAERYIQVIPEIDMPGHMLGALCAYPELGCTGGPYELWEMWGVSEEVLCAGNPKTVDFLHGVLEELCAVFPSDLIHLGGDECPKTRWKACPKCQAKIKELGLTTATGKSLEDQLQSYLLKDAEAFLAKKGRAVIGWDEVLEGGLGDNTWVMSWRGHDGGREAARLHHNVIMSPVSHCYFDYYQTKNHEWEPMAFAADLPIEKVYSLEPVPDGLTPDEAKYIQGVQCNLWSEYILSPQHMEYMLLPRLAALTEVQWMQTDKKSYDAFAKRLPRLIKLYDKLGYTHHRF